MAGWPPCPAARRLDWGATGGPFPADPDSPLLVDFPADATRLRRLFALLGHAEPALLSLVSPERAARFRPLREVEPELARLRSLDAWRARFARPAPELAVDPHGLLTSERRALEVRLLESTVDPRVLRSWAALWSHLVVAVERGVRPPPGRRAATPLLCAGPRGDVVELVRLVGGDADLARALALRRDEVAHAWARLGPPWDTLVRRARAGWWSP